MSGVSDWSTDERALSNSYLANSISKIEGNGTTDKGRLVSNLLFHYSIKPHHSYKDYSPKFLKMLSFALSYSSTVIAPLE